MIPRHVCSEKRSIESLSFTEITEITLYFDESTRKYAEKRLGARLSDRGQMSAVQLPRHFTLHIHVCIYIYIYISYTLLAIRLIFILPEPVGR